MAHLMPFPIAKFFDANGIPLAGGKLYTYIATTTTPQATYTDADEGTPNANPQILDANGQAVVWLGVGKSYKIVLKDSTDVTLWTADKVTDIGIGEITTAMLADHAVTTVKIAGSAVTATEIADGAVGTSELATGAVTAVKIPDAGIPIVKLAASTEIGFVETSGPRYGDGPTAFPRKPWSAPALIGSPSSPALGDGLSVKWSPNGKILAVAENNNDYVALFSRYGSELKRLTGAILGPPSSPGSTVAWSPDGKYLVTGGTATPAEIFQRAGHTYGNALTPASGIAGIGVTGVDWCPNGDYFAVSHPTTPYISVLKRTDVEGNHVVARYGSANGQAVANSTNQVVNFEVSQVDNMAAVVIGSGWTFFAPRRNTYQINVRVTLTNLSFFFTDLNTYFVYLYKNGSLFSVIDLYNVNTAGVNQTIKMAGGSESLQLEANDTIFIMINENATAASMQLKADVAYNNISIVEEGGYDSLSSFALLSNPSSLPTGNAKCCKWSPDGLFLAVGHATSPFVTIYQRTGDTFAKCADPATLPAGQVNGLDWSPDGLTLTCVHATTPFITSYSRASVSGVTFTKIADPAVLPAGNGNGCAYNSTGDRLAVAHDSSPYVTIYSVSGSTYTKNTDPVDLPVGNGKSVSWTPDGQYLSVGFVGSPYVYTYRTSGVYGNAAVTYVNEVNLV